MPSIAEAPISPHIGNGKKRRWEDESAGESEGMTRLTSPHYKRPTYDENISPLRHINPNDVSNAEFQLKQMMMKAKRHDSKRQRVPSAYDNINNIQIISSHTNHEMRDLTMDIDVDGGVQDERLEERAREVKVDLSPCHICRRKPTAKHELDTFAHCERCGERTCYVCIRECLGMADLLGVDRSYDRRRDEEPVWERKGPVWHNSTNGVLEEDMLDYAPSSPKYDAVMMELGKERVESGERHRGRICSHCCEERGPDGDVWCFGCLTGY